MAARGPAPTPLKLVQIRGNPGKRRVNKNTPTPKVGTTCPAWLSEHGKKLWRRLGPHLKTLGLLTQIDRETFAALCESYAMWRKMRDEVICEGETVITTKNNVIQNPKLGIANQALKEFHRLAGEFGLTPAARVRLTAQGEIKPRQGSFFSDLDSETG